MKTQVFKDMIIAIRSEQELREKILDDLDPDVAADQWLFTDKPLINELCLTVLVSLRHYIERNLIDLAARSGESSDVICKSQYQKNINQLKGPKWIDWKKIEKDGILRKNGERSG